MKPGRILLLISLILLGIIIFLNKCQHTSSIDKNKITSAQSLSVDGMVVTTQKLEYPIYTTGTLLANEEVDLKNEVAGRVIKINFIEGTFVKRGSLLVKLYDSDLQSQLKKLQYQEELALKVESRQKALLLINGISQQDYEISQNELNTIKADIEIVKTSISKTEIKAPFDGKIGLKTISEGAFLQANSTIASIHDIDPIKVEFSIPEKFIHQINYESPIQFSTSTDTILYSAKIYAIEPKIEISNRSLKIRAKTSNSEHKLLPGEFVRVTIPLKTNPSAVLIPSQSLIPELAGKSVYISEQGFAKKISVETGMRFDSTVEIMKGISAGDTILTSGMMQVRPKMPLNVTITY